MYLENQNNMQSFLSALIISYHPDPLHSHTPLLPLISDIQIIISPVLLSPLYLCFSHPFSYSCVKSITFSTHSRRVSLAIFARLLPHFQSSLLFTLVSTRLSARLLALLNVCRLPPRFHLFKPFSRLILRSHVSRMISDLRLLPLLPNVLRDFSGDQITSIRTARISRLILEIPACRNRSIKLRLQLILTSP